MSIEPLSYLKFLQDYRSELETFLAISADFKEQDKEKRAGAAKAQKLKLESCFMRLLEVGHMARTLLNFGRHK